MSTVKFYQVGGSVRDLYLHRVCKSADIDYAVEAESYAKMKQAVLELGHRICHEKPEFLSLRAIDSCTREVIDYTLCRKDGTYSDHRHPDQVEIGTIMTDLGRRDFTINAMALTVGTERVLLDPYGGLADLEARMIRCVGETRDRIMEDPLRLMRALRFAITLDFQLSEELKQSLLDPEIIQFLTTIPVERRAQELTKMFKFDTAKTVTMLGRYTLLMQPIFSDGLWLLPTTKSYYFGQREHFA